MRRVATGGSRLYGYAVARYTAGDAAMEDLARMRGVLEAAGVPYFLIPREPGEGVPLHALGVEADHRAAVLARAAEHFGRTAAYAGVVGPEGTVTAAALWADGGLPRAVRRADVLRVGTLRLGPAGQLLCGLETGCDIEFWHRGRELGDTDPAWLTVPGAQLRDTFDAALVAPRPNAVSEVVPAAAQRPGAAVVAGHRVPTFAPFAQPGVDEVGFPVDAVYTWVDGDDPVLAAKRRAYGDGAAGAIAARETGPSRYTSHDELKYSLRSMEMYAGFIRHVFVVTDGQIPEWLDPDAEGLTVVDHRDIFPSDALPVFNSHAIESRLHHLPGLSERYLYFNDDVFINRPVDAGRFFHANGIARIPLSPLKLGLGAPHPMEPAPNSAGKNAREVISRIYGRQITHKSLHTPHPQLLSVMREVEDMGIEEFTRTSYSRFRSTTDVSPVSTLHHHWAILSGRAVPAPYLFRYVELGKPDMRRRLARLAAGEDVDFFCLNDVDIDPASHAAVHAVIRAFLERKYPFPSRFERTAEVPPQVVRDVRSGARAAARGPEPAL